MTDTEPAADHTHPLYRVGRKCARNIYLVNPHTPWQNDVHIGCMFSPEYGPIVVNALNAMHANTSARP